MFIFNLYKNFFRYKYKIYTIYKTVNEPCEDKINEKKNGRINFVRTFKQKGGKRYNLKRFFF